MIQKEILTEYFAPIIWANLEALQNIKTKNLDDKLKKTIQQKLKNALNKTLRYWEEDQPKMISVKAMNLLTSHNNKIVRGNKLSLENFLWGKDRSKLGKNTEGKDNIFFEHTTPVDQIISTLIEKCQCLEDVKYQLNNTLGVCIITTEENDIIPSKHNKQRPDGWEKCYDECGIKIFQQV